MSTGQKIRMPEAWRYGERPPQGSLYEYDRALDDLREYLTDAVTFAKVKNLLRAVDSGDIATTLRLFEEIELKDAHLQGVCGTRRKALTRLDWEIVSAAESQRFHGDKTLADEAAAYCEEKLSGLESFSRALRHLAEAIGPNLAVLEVIWHDVTIEELVPIPSRRLQLDAQDLSVLQIITTEHRQGTPIGGAKWVVHTPDARAGADWAQSVSYALAYIYAIKLLATADWAMFVHRFGVPFLMAKHGAVDSAEKTAIKNMLTNWGTGGWAMFSDAVAIDTIESSQRGTAPQKDLIEWCSRQESIAMLGQALTTDTTGETGTYAAASVQNLVRGDLLEDDIAAEGETIRGQLLKPMCIYGFPGRSVPYPEFRRVLPEPRDELQEAQKLSAAQQAGIRVPRDWAHERTGIPRPNEGEEVLEPSLGAFGEGMEEGI